MHEYGVAQEIVEMVTERAGDRTIVKLNLRIGELSGIFADSLTMYLELLMRDRQVVPVSIAITGVPAQFLCSCGHEYKALRAFDPCPACGGFDRTIVDGSTCSIESIEVEDE